MKKSILFFAVMLIALGISVAQQNGNIVLGGSISYSSETEDTDSYYDVSYSNFLFGPNIGIMLNDNCALGVSIAYVSTKYEYDDDDYSNDTDKSQAITLMPYLRFFQNISEKFSVYFEPYGGKTYILKSETDENTKIFQLGMNLGISYSLSQKLSVEMNLLDLNYINLSNSEYDAEASSLTLNYDMVSPTIGVKFYL